MSKSSIFRPSKLSDVADQIWKKSAADKEENKSESKPFSLGLLEGMTNRKLPEVPVASTSGEKSAVADSFVFGQNIEERVVVIPTDPTELSAAKLPVEENVKENLTEPSGKTAVEPNKLSSEPVKMVTGEEDENCVYHALCKLFLLDKEKNKWNERGRGTLKINDKGSLYARHTDESEKFESRMVMRTQGSLRVILNSKIWSDMKVTRVSDKSISLSAFDCESGGIQAYLITASVKESESMENCIQDRIAHLKSGDSTSVKSEVKSPERKRKFEGGEEEKKSAVVAEEPKRQKTADENEKKVESGAEAKDK